MALTKPRAYQIYDIDYKQAVRVVTVSNIVLSGGAPNSVDGVNLSLNDRILVAGQTSGAQNGLYYVTTVGSGSNGTWARSVDGNQTGEIEAGMIVMVVEGITYADTQWKLTTNDPITIGVTSLTFIQNFQGPILVNGTSNIQIPTANSNIVMSVNGTPNVVVYAPTGEYVTGILSVSGNALLGNVLTDGYYYANGQAFGGGSSSAQGLNTNVQFNDNGVFGGTAGFTFNKVSNAVAVTGNITSSGNISGSYLLGNGTFITGLSASKIFNGTSEANIGTSGGNANITIGGTSNVVVVSTSGVSVTGNTTSTGLVGTVYTNSIINTGGNGTGNIGSSSLYFNTVFAKATSAQYADLAEMYQGDQSYMPGTVVEFGGTHEVTMTTELSSTRIAGVVSTNPSYLMNSGLNTLGAVPVALIGRVPCQVLGPIRKGDRLVSSVLPGVAQALDISTYQPGCIIGKSLEDWPDASVKSIEVVVGRL